MRQTAHAATSSQSNGLYSKALVNDFQQEKGHLQTHPQLPALQLTPHPRRVPPDPLAAGHPPVLSAQLITAPTGRPREMRNFAPEEPPRPAGRGEP